MPATKPRSIQMPKASESARMATRAREADVIYETVRRRIQESIDVTTCNYIVGVFAFGNMTERQAMRNLDLFTTRVIPALKPARL